MFAQWLLLVACSPPGGEERRSGAPDTPHREDTTPDPMGGETGESDGGDSSPSPDTGLIWDGDVAAYPGCVAGDPGAKLLSQVSPAGPVGAGAGVSGEVVFANCESTTWVVAPDVAALSGVKLGSTSGTVADTWGAARVLLPADVPPGHAVRVRWSATAPLVNGPHPWQWRLVDEWVRWIGDPTPMVYVEVTGGYGPFDVHSRAEWEEASMPVDGPDMDLSALEFITIHYNGVIEDLDGDDDVYQDADAIDRIRNVQSYSIATNDGVSAGYNSYIAPDGDEWEIRGHDIRNAASGCLDVNIPGYTLVIPTTSPDAAPTGAQIEGAKAAILRIRAAAAAAGNTNFLSLNGHRDVAPTCGLGTSCPGEPLYALLGAGLLEP
jgi:hypothetical protein